MPTRTFSIQRQASVLYPLAYASANDRHHPVGKNGSYYTRTYLQFYTDWSDMANITAAVLRMKTTGQVHLAFGSSPNISYWRNNDPWSASGGSENSWVASGEPTPAPAAKGSALTGTCSNAEDTVRDFDILGLIRAWAPTSVGVPGYSPATGLGESNNGIQIRATDESNAAHSIEFYSSLGGYAPSIIVTYDSGVPPDSPTLGTPSGKGTSLTPTFTLTARDTAPAVLANYDIQVSTVSDFSSTVWNLAASTTGITGQAVSRAYAGSALSRGVTYYWRARTTNDAGLTGPWSSGKTFSINQLPVNNTTGIAPSGTISAVSLGTTDPGDPTFTFGATDPDAGDTIASYDLQVTTDPTFATITLLDIVASTTGLSAGKVTRAPAAVFVRGTTYYWRWRFKDSAGEYGPYSSSTRTFKFRALPSATLTTGALATIGNLTDKNIWTSGGSHAKPTLAWSVTDPDGGGQTKYRVRIYSASSGGTTIWDSGTVTSTSKSATSANGIVNGTNYWYTVQPSNKYEDGLETARQQFHVRWAQAIYAANVTTGADNVTFKNASTNTGTQTAFIFRGSADAAGTSPTAWYTTIGSVPASAWIQVLVRLATQTSGTSAKVPDMTMTWTTTATAPDGIGLIGAGTTVARDAGVLFGGSPSLKVRTVPVGTTSGVLFRYPLAGSYVPVQPGQVYTFSAWVQTAAPVTGAPIKLLITNGDDGVTLRSSLGRPHGQVTDSTGVWTRIWDTFTTPDGTTSVRLYVHQGSATGDDTYWVAAPQLEVGAIAGPPVPNLSSDLATWDGVGGQVDASQGGILRLRGSGGGSRDTVDLGVSGLLFANDVHLYSALSGRLTAMAAAGTDTGILGYGNVGNRAYVGASLIGDAVHRTIMYGDATMAGVQFGDGSLTRDTNLYRAAADTLKTDDAFQAVGAMTALGPMRLNNVITPTALAADTADWNPAGLATCNVIRYTSDTTVRALSGIVAQPAGTLIWLVNSNSATALTLKHQITSVAANQFLCPGSVDYSVTNRSSVLLWYDGASARWRVLGGVA